MENGEWRMEDGTDRSDEPGEQDRGEELEQKGTRIPAVALAFIQLVR
jgi:hypothetical protein